MTELTKFIEAYERGDYDKAFKLSRPLAEQGDAEAQYMLADMYDEGHGVPQDDAEAIKWYLKAAEQGHADAQNIRDSVVELMTADQIAEAERLAREWRPTAQ